MTPMMKVQRIARSTLALTMIFAILFTPIPSIEAADHGDAIAAPLDRPADIADVYAFLDPNDDKRVVLILTLVGFIATGENEAFGFFDPLVRYSVGIENTGDAKQDLFLDVTFTKPISRSIAQTATIKLSHRKKGKDAGAKLFTAPATLASAQFVAPPRVLTTDPATGITFFAGLADDPFFFDVPAEIFYRDSRFAGTSQSSGFGSIDDPDPSTIDPTVFNRARDSFAGYNVLSIALSAPVELLQGPAGNILGIYGATARHKRVTHEEDGTAIGKGEFIQIDSQATPVVNVVLTAPYTDRDRFNALLPDSSTFAAGIVQMLRRLQTRQPGIDLLKQIAVANGDYLRLDTSIPNMGPEGGTNPPAGFPNGRRLGDDVTRTIVSIINNILDPNPSNPNEGDQDDGVTANDEPFLNEFPFLAPSLQPLPNTGDVCREPQNFRTRIQESFAP